MKSQQFAAVLATSLVLGSLASGQCVQQSLPAGYETYTANYITFVPIASPNDRRCQFIVDSTEFAATGPIVIREIYLRCFDAVQGGFWPSVEINLASATHNYSDTTNNLLSFAGNLGPDLANVRPPSPWNPGPQSQRAWVPLGINAVFGFNPTLGNDLVVEFKRCGTGTPWTHPTYGTNVFDAKGPTTPTRAMSYYQSVAAGSCATSVTPTASQTDFTNVILIDYYPVGGTAADWQVNHAPASFDLDGNVQNGPCTGPIDYTVPGGDTIFANVNSNLSNGWDLAFGFGFGVPASGGGFTLPGNGDIVNVDFTTAPSFLNNLSFAYPFAPFSLPFALAAPIPLDLYAQFVMLNPGAPAGFSLSALTQLHLQPQVPSLPGPAGDDESLEVRFTRILGAPTSLPFYGNSYSRFNLVSNGRVMFGSTNNVCCAGTTLLAAATAALADSPFAAAAWSDLNPSAGGSITVDSPAANQVACHWVNVPYYGTATSNTLDLIFDAGASTVQFNYTALQAFPAAPGTSPEQFIGLAAGTGVATDQGATVFAPTMSSITGPANHGMLYSWAVNGPAVTGLTSIIFYWNSGTSQYDWAAF